MNIQQECTSRLTNQSIFNLVDIDLHIINFLDPMTDFFLLSCINKYYNNLVKQNKLFVEFKIFTTKIHFANEKKDFINACKYGYVLVAQYFCNKYTIDIHAGNEYAFQLACGNGHIETAKWLFNLSNEISSIIGIHADNERPFRWACYGGHIGTAKWLFNLSNEISSIINIHADNELAFGWACYFGHIETAKWLFSLSNEISSIINIHADNERPFRWACYGGHIEIAKWLFNLSNEISSIINIHADNECAFIQACTNDHIEIAKWLCSLCSKYEITIDSDCKKITHYNIMQ
jgi:ankyrin repeat protein